MRPIDETPTTRLDEWTRPDGTRVVQLTLTEADRVRMDREQLDMLSDAVFLMQTALRGKSEGPLTLPKTGLPVRV